MSTLKEYGVKLNLCKTKIKLVSSFIESNMINEFLNTYNNLCLNYQDVFVDVISFNKNSNKTLNYDEFNSLDNKLNTILNDNGITYFKNPRSKTIKKCLIM